MFSRGRRCKVEFEVKVERAEGLPSDLKGKSFYVALKRGQEYSGHSSLMVSKDSEMSVGHSFKFTSYLDWAEKAKGTFLPKELKFKIVTKRKRFLEAKVAEAKFDLSKLVSIGGARREEGKQRIRCCGKKDTCIVLVVTFNAKVLKIDGKVLKKVPKEPEEGGRTSSGDGGADVEASQVGREPQRERQFVRVNDESYCLETDLEMSEQQVRSLGDSLSESVLSLRDLGEDDLSESELILRLEKEKRGESDVDEVEESSHAERDHRSEEEAKQDLPSGQENSVSGEAELGRLQGRRRSNERAERWLEESAPQSNVGDEVAKLSLSSDIASWGGGKEKFRGLHGSDDVVHKLKQEEARRRRLSADLRSLDSESVDRYDQVCAKSFGAEDLGKGENAKKKKKGTLKRLGLHFLSKEKSKSLKSDHSSERPAFDKPAHEDAPTHLNSTGNSRRLLKKSDESDAEKSKVDSSSMSTSDGQESRSGSYSKEDELAEKSHESSSTDKDARHSSRKLTSRPRSEKGERDGLKKRPKEEDLEESSRDKGKPDVRTRGITLDRNSFDDGELSYKTSDEIGDRPTESRPKLIRSSSFRELGDLLSSRSKERSERSMREILNYYKDQEDILPENWNGAEMQLTSEKMLRLSETGDSYGLCGSPSSSHRMIRRLSDAQTQLAVYEELDAQREKIESLLYNSPWTYTQEGRNESAEKFADYVLDSKAIESRSQYTRNSRKLFINVLSALYGQSVRHACNLEVLLGTFCWIVALLSRLVGSAEAPGHLDPDASWIKDVSHRGVVHKFSNIEEAYQEMGCGSWNVTEVFNRLVEDLTPSESFFTMSSQLCSYFYVLIFSALIQLVRAEAVCQAFAAQCDHEDTCFRLPVDRTEGAAEVHEFRDAAHMILSMLDPFFQHAEKHHLPDCLKVQLLGQIFHFVDAELVNFVFRHPSHCSAKTGISIKMAASHLDQWISSQRYGRRWTRYLEDQFGPALDVANVLTIDKRFFGTDEFEQVFPRLSAVQIHQLLSHFHSDEFSDEIIPSKTLDALGTAARECVSKSIYLDSTLLQTLDDDDELAESDFLSH